MPFAADFGYGSRQERPEYRGLSQRANLNERRVSRL
jgi:hypothetical protein